MQQRALAAGDADGSQRRPPAAPARLLRDLLGAEPDLLAVRRPAEVRGGQRVAAAEHPAAARGLEHHDALVLRAVLDGRDQLAVRREARRAQAVVAAVEDGADRELQPPRPVVLAYDGHAQPVGVVARRPVGRDHVRQHLARGAARRRHVSERCADAHRRLVERGVRPPREDRQVAGGRHGREVAVGDGSLRAAARLGPCLVDLEARAARPRRRVQHRAAVGPEARRRDRAVAERQPLEVGQRTVPQQPPGGDADPADRDRDEQVVQVPRPPSRRAALERHRGARDDGERLEREREVARGLEALGRVLLESSVNDPRERGRERWVDLGGVALARGGEDLGRRRAVERRHAREHLVQHRAEREHVGARVGHVAVDALRRDVAGCPEQRLRDRLARRRRGRPLRRAAAAQAGEAEVEDLHPPVAGQDDVRGLDVVVQDAPRVGRGEPVADLDRGLERLADGQPAAQQPALQRLSLDELEDDVRDVALVPDIVDGHDRRVLDRSGGARLVLEQPEPLGVARRLEIEELDRDVAAEAGVARTVHLGHPADTEGGEELVGPQSPPHLRHGRRGCHRDVRLLFLSLGGGIPSG